MPGADEHRLLSCTLSCSNSQGTSSRSFKMATPYKHMQRCRPKKDFFFQKTVKKTLTSQASESNTSCPSIKVFIRANGVQEWSIRSTFNFECRYITFMSRKNRKRYLSTYLPRHLDTVICSIEDRIFVNSKFQAYASKFQAYAYQTDFCFDYDYNASQR